MTLREDLQRWPSDADRTVVEQSFIGGAFRSSEFPPKPWMRGGRSKSGRGEADLRGEGRNEAYHCDPDVEAMLMAR